MKNKILLLSGDPNSINSEIIFKCWKNLSISKRKNIYLISNYNLLKKQFKILKYNIKMEKVKNIKEKNNSNKLKILDIDLKFKNPFKVPYKNSSIFVKKILNLAHKLASEKEVKGMINCPIDKKLLGKNNKGVTEFLASKCKIKDGTEVMLISNRYLSVSPLTTHIKIKDVNKRIFPKIIIKKIATIDKWFRKIYRKRPKIGVLGLNPHNAELRTNTEERKIILPSINKLKKRGLKIEGPLVADTLFINDYKNYNVIVGMYHDQVLAPFKTLYKFDAINITLGLNYYRVSPDHGVALNILKKKIASHLSLLRCIEFLLEIK